MKILHFYHQPANSRGVYTFHRNLMEADVDGYVINSFQHESTIEDTCKDRSYTFEEYSIDEVIEIAEGYDMVIMSNFVPDHDLMWEIWSKIRIPYKVFICHGDGFKRSVYDATKRFFPLSDSILTYSNDNLLARAIRKDDPTSWERIISCRHPIAWNVYRDKVEDSFDTVRNLPYAIESGVWEGRTTKNSAGMAGILQEADSIGLKFEDFIFLHIGISFSPAVHFGQMLKYPENSVKCGKKIDRYMDDDFNLIVPGIDSYYNKVFLMRNYTQEWMRKLFTQSHFTYSLMTPIKENGTINPNIAGRFEYAHLEKCMYSLPILDSNFLRLFVDMKDDVRESFLSIDSSNPESIRTDLPLLYEEMVSLVADPNTYNDRRRKILGYIKEKFTVETFLKSLQSYDKR